MSTLSTVINWILGIFTIGLVVAAIVVLPVIAFKKRRLDRFFRVSRSR